jgi:hypothetical protein
LRTLSAAENRTRLHSLVHGRKPLFFLRARPERQQHDQRDEVRSGDSFHSELVEFGGKIGTPIRASGAALGLSICSLFFALPAEFHATKRADEANERPAIRAGIAFRCTLLVAAGSADHRIAFAEDFVHVGLFFFVPSMKGGLIGILTE